MSTELMLDCSSITALLFYHKGIELKFVKEGRVGEAPKVPQSRMEVVCIISYKFNKFDNKAISSSEFVRGVLSFSHLAHLRHGREVDAEVLVGSKVNSLVSATYMMKECILLGTSSIL